MRSNKTITRLQRIQQNWDIALQNMAKPTKIRKGMGKKKHGQGDPLMTKQRQGDPESWGDERKCWQSSIYLDLRFRHFFKKRPPKNHRRNFYGDGMFLVYLFEKWIQQINPVVNSRLNRGSVPKRNRNGTKPTFCMTFIEKWSTNDSVIRA